MLTAILAALLNLSTLVANQPKIAKRGIMVLLKTNSSLFQLVSNKVGHAGADCVSVCFVPMASHHSLPLPLASGMPLMTSILPYRVSGARQEEQRRCLMQPCLPLLLINP